MAGHAPAIGVSSKWSFLFLQEHFRGACGSDPWKYARIGVDYLPKNFVGFTLRFCATWHQGIQVDLGALLHQLLNLLNKKSHPTFQNHHDKRLQSKTMPEQLAAMSANTGKLNSKIEHAVADGQLMESAAKKIRTLFAEAPSDLYLRAVEELVDSNEWSELNDRFYRTLAFGTGGIRGRTIGRIVTKAERGNSHEDQRPGFPCIGTNAMNFFNISRATRGLVAYLHDCNRREKISAKPKIVIAYDPRFFSKEFASLAAEVASENGCDAFVFDGPR